MYGGNTYLSNAPQRYRVGPIISNGAFHYALETSPYSRDPKYILAVMRSYIEVKEARGRTKQEIGWKLEILERELPGYGSSFQAIREEKRLPRSRVLGRQSLVHHHPRPDESLQDQYILGHGAPSRHASSASARPPRASGVNEGRRPSGVGSGGQMQQTLRASAAAAPARNPEDTDEPPPPPYASEDPEPDATRELQMRLAQEAEAQGRLNLPEPSVNTHNTGDEGRGSNNENAGGEGGHSPGAGNDGPATATSPQTAYSPPPGPPPIASASGTSLHREESRRSKHHPSTPPTDPEEARIWEESQLEEAKRLSRASERERLELEQAMRLSLADAESSASGSGSRSGGSGVAGPSSSAHQAMPAVFEADEREGSSGPASRRMSSYTPSHDLEGSHRRAASDANAHGGRPAVENVTRAMDHLTIPDGWGSGNNSSGMGGQSNLMDDDFGAAGPSQPALAPQRTGAVMQSNNPFLSPGEQDEPPLPSTPSRQSQPSSPYQAHRQPSSSSLRDSPGSSRTQYQAPAGPPPEKTLPSIPDSFIASPTVYDPPSGPPPAPSFALATDNRGNDAAPPLPSRNFTSDASPSASEQGRRPLPIPQGTLPPSLPRRNISGQIYTPSNPPRSSFPDHSPNTPLSPSPSFFPPQTPAAQSSPQSAALHRAISTHHGGEDPLEMLRDFHTVFLVDDSTSMSGERWQQARQALMGVAETAARYDETGVDIYFLNSKRVGKELRTPADVEDLFAGLEPRGATPTGLRLEAILREYMTRLERSQITSPGLDPGETEHVKPMNLIVVTDGVFAHPVLARLRALAVNPNLNRSQLLGIAPVDDPESVLIACAKRLDKGEFPLSQVGVQFLQIGDDSDVGIDFDRRNVAREALQELDDGLASAHGVRDMVDTVLFSGEEISASLIVKTLLGGINRRLDRRSA